MDVIAQNLELDAQSIGHLKGAGVVASVKPQAIGLCCHYDFAAARRTVQGMSREVFHHWVCWRGWWMQLGNMGGSFGGGLVVEPGKGNAAMDALWWELQAGSELSKDRAVAAG
jgi:hypothetical protein